MAPALYCHIGRSASAQEVSSSSGSESESDSDDERERELEHALTDVPFVELQRARADGSLVARAASAAATEKKARRASKKKSCLTLDLLAPLHRVLLCVVRWLMLVLMGSLVFVAGRWR
jgi:hypothetical protein